MSLRSFPATATEDQMREALQMINLGYMLNPAAHLAMSWLGFRGVDSASSSAQPGVEASMDATRAGYGKKLEQLFLAYKPAAV